MKSLISCVVFVLLHIASFSQDNITIRKTNEQVILDGILDEPVWKKHKVEAEFWEYFPVDSVKAKFQTEVYFTYDDKNIYLAAKAYSKGKDYITPSLRRDFRAGGSDNLSFVLDTFHDNNNAFMFGVNPYGVVREALIYNGGTDNSYLNVFWDNKWQAQSVINEDSWTTEVIIPLSTIRFKDGSDLWNFKVYRFDSQANEQSSIKRMPQNQLIMSLGYSLPIKFEEPLHKFGKNISLIPYVSAGQSHDFESKSSTKRFSGLGFDAKVGVTSGLNLDLTVNPDFSTVEADRQVVNLTRFDITFPEQRQFFIENSDLFTGFGSYNTNPFLPASNGVVSSGNQIVSPFFSRKIGIALDTSTGVNVQNKILYGARLSGKIDDNWRIGVLNAQTGSDSLKGIVGSNYTVAALTRRLFQRSNIAAILVNKQVFNHDPESKVSKYNRVVGLEYNYQSNDNKWQGKSFYHQAITTVDTAKGKFAHGVSLNYTGKNIIAKWSHDLVGEGFETEAGFVPRNNFFHINPTVGYVFSPKSRVLNRLSLGLALDGYFQPKLGTTDLQTGPFVVFAFKNTIRILTSVNYNETYLFKAFDVLRKGEKALFYGVNTKYNYWNWTTVYVSDLRKKFNYTLQPLIGQYYDGSIVSVSGTLNYRVQPYGLITMNVAYNHIDIKKGKNDVMVIGPKLDLTFSKKLFWTSYVQYNSQFKNLNVNSRLQWRFAPVSDFFIVYSDNYDTVFGNVKNRAIQAKITYWLNV
jgi:hypothetical protein